jgi:hypothetical protein
MCPQDASASLMTEKLATELTQDGFYLLKSRFELPLDNGALDPKTQLDLLICHLFVNNKCSISAIARIGIDPQALSGLYLSKLLSANGVRGQEQPEAYGQKKCIPLFLLSDRDDDRGKGTVKDEKGKAKKEKNKGRGNGHGRND